LSRTSDPMLSLSKHAGFIGETMQRSCRKKMVR
jgi:hypothetical protein